MFDVFYLDRPTGLFPHERPAETVEHARDLSRTRYLWIVSDLNDYSNFDWCWEPAPWQSQQMHVWPSQHQANSGTMLVPKAGWQDVNREHDVVLRIDGAPVLHIKHCGASADRGDVNTRFIADYLGTLRRALSRVDWSWCWVTSDVCDYMGFDWTWHPSEWQDRMLHVWASDDQKFGDTFYLHVPTFLDRTRDLALLEWFDTIHFVEGQSVPRHPVPVHRHRHDSQVPAVWEHDFQSPVVQFVRHDLIPDPPAMNLWREQTRAVVPLTPGAGSVLVPREAKNHLSTQLYDYPHIDKSRQHLGQDPPLDVIFISNGESTADQHWQDLVYALQRGHHNRAVRSDGVNGRVAAYQAAARVANTDWFFAVFAKLRVSADFDWSWQPDRLQQAKHYIFHAQNPVNGLIYGHQAMIAYNRRLVLANTGQGLDFTLDDEHEVVPILSGTAYYADSAWTAWRTAFRESIKLRHSLPDVENDYRLQRWMTQGHGRYGAFSVMGAQDAMTYYDEVKGDFTELRKTYEWAWLSSYAMIVRPQLFTQSNT